jgi:hypothetical protein
MDGQAFTLWAVRAAACCYAAAVALSLRRLPHARSLWTLGFLLYLAHVWGAFEFFHGWSHGAACAETAKQTAETFGVRWGGGLYFNYAFTLAWAFDCAWWWTRGGDYPGKAWLRAFLAFMFFNGVVVFGRGAVRWTGLAVAAALLALRFGKLKL